MKKASKKHPGPAFGESARIDPERRLCSNFDSKGITRQKIARRKEMGFRVVDNFCEEHIM